MSGRLIEALLILTPKVRPMVDFCTTMSDNVLSVLTTVALLMLIDKERLTEEEATPILDKLSGIK